MKITETFHLAELEDIIDATKMVEAFYNESPYTELPFAFERVRNQLEYMSLDKHRFLVGLSKVDGNNIGLIVGQKVLPTFSEEPVGVELSWYIRPEYRGTPSVGKEMMDAFETWAKQVGCKAVQTSMLSTSPALVEKLYYRRGYQKTEMSFQKRI